MQDWFFVQSAEYGRYYIDVEINGYDVYKVSLYVQDEPGSATLGFPYDETTTGKKEYAKRRYKCQAQDHIRENGAGDQRT